MPKTRLDALLVERGLYGSRSRAAAAVLAGDVRLGGDGQRAAKPGQLVDTETAVDVARQPEWVSRGGHKLVAALERFGVEPAGRRCLDVGASTGGFTDVLLSRGAAAVTALDVGYGELDWRLRNDARVTVLERTNARRIAPGALPYAPDLITVDVSFISLTKVLPAVLACAAPRFDCLAMAKPQFELGRERVGRGGVVREAADRRAALLAVAEHARALGYAVLGFASSGLPGPAGNRETFVWIAEPDRAGAVEDVGAAAHGVEP